MPVYLKLFDTVFRSGIMPQTWGNCIITPVFVFFFVVVLENYSVQFGHKDFLITLNRLIFYINLKLIS